MPPRFDARCPNCGSLERHRLFFLMAESRQLIVPAATLLHIAPEVLIRQFLESRCKSYKTLDLYRSDVDIKRPLEDTGLPNASFDHVVCSHVLEHVDDGKALEELFRILKPGGTLFAMVPIVEGWDTTYEDPRITSEVDRTVHFGQSDHVRYYGRDFRERIGRAGFSVEELTAEGPDVVKFGLMRGEKVFIARKP